LNIRTNSNLTLREYSAESRNKLNFAILNNALFFHVHTTHVSQNAHICCVSFNLLKFVDSGSEYARDAPNRRQLVQVVWDVFLRAIYEFLLLANASWSVSIPVPERVMNHDLFTFLVKHGFVAFQPFCFHIEL